MFLEEDVYQKMLKYSDDFERDGFCIIRGAINLKTINNANLVVDEFLIRHKPMLEKKGLLNNGLLQRVVNFHHSLIPLKDVFIEAIESSSEVTDIFGPATLYTSLFFELGSQQSLHRDTPYFFSGNNRGGYMGVWAALDNVDESNGPLIAVKGSHKLSEPDLMSLKSKFHPSEPVPPSSPELFNAYNEELISMAKKAGLETVVCNVSKGDVIVWNPATLHGGTTHINKEKTRRSFVMHVTPQNMPMKHMDHFFDRTKFIEPVDKVYENYCGRLIEDGDKVDFMHKETMSVNYLGRFENKGSDTSF